MQTADGSVYKNLTVPYGLLQYAVRNGDFKNIQILLAAKALYGNGFYSADLASIARVCRLHIKTVRKHITTFSRKNWIGVDPVSGRYFNRGWRFIRTAIEDKSSVGYTIPTGQLYQFKAFAIGATYDQLIAAQQYRTWLKSREGIKKGTLHQTGLQSAGFYPVANSAYAAIFGMSESTASRYRQIACDVGFIERQDDLLLIEVDRDTKLHKELMVEYCKQPLIFRDDKYWIQKITHVRSKMIRKKISTLLGEKTATIKKGNSKGNRKIREGFK